MAYRVELLDSRERPATMDSDLRIQAHWGNIQAVKGFPPCAGAVHLMDSDVLESPILILPTVDEDRLEGVRVPLMILMGSQDERHFPFRQWGFSKPVRITPTKRTYP